MNTTTNAPQTAGAQRRYLSILFSDLSQSARLAESLEAEHYAEILGRLRQACREIIARHGGRIVQLLGDGIVAMFGYPDASEEDGRRATEAALDLHKAVRELPVSTSPLPTPLALHTGIHAGVVLLGEGDIERGRFELLGNATNIAARLSDLAPFDQIYVSEAALGSATNFFIVERENLTLQGFDRKIAAYRVFGRASARSRFEARTARGRTSFVGRDAEIECLEAELLEARAGCMRTVAIVAGAGMGKTRLIEEFLRRPPVMNCQIFRGYCEAHLSAEPLQPFLQMLRAFFQFSDHLSAAAAGELAEAALDRLESDLSAHRAELVRLLSIIVPGGPDRRPAAAASTAALRALTGALAARKPLILVIDDWQWADDASRNVVRALSWPDRPILLILATRESQATQSAACSTSIELAPLSPAEGTQAIARLLPGAAPFVAAQIYEHSGGNPLFIEELCHSATADGFTAPAKPLTGAAAWLSALTEARLGRLPVAQADIVRAAAVIGNVLPVSLFESITGLKINDPLVKELAEHDFLFPSEPASTLRFKHGITRDAIYNAVGLHQRRAIHMRAADALLAQDPSFVHENSYEALAHHYYGGGEFAAAARFAELAAAKAMAAAALDRARVHYRTTLSALDQLGIGTREVQLKWCQVVQQLGFACVFDPLGLQDELALFERGVTLAQACGDLEVLARAEYWLSYFYYAKGEAHAARPHCERGLALAIKIGSASLEGQLHAVMGQILAATCHYDRALTELDTAVETKKRRSDKGQSQLAAGSAYSLSCKALILGDRGEFPAANECFAEALALLQGSSHQVKSSVLGWMGTAQLWQGRWHEAKETAEQAASIADLVRSSHLFAMTRSLAGYATWRLGDEAEALARILDATTWIELRKGKFFLSINYGFLTEILTDASQYPAARKYAGRTLVRARQADRLGEAMACRAMARLAASSHDYDRADHFLTLAMQCADIRSSRHERAKTQVCAAQIEAARGRRSDARALLDHACVAFESMDMRWHLSQALDLQRPLD